MNESRATRYQRLRRRTAASGVASAAAMLAVVALTPVAPWLRDIAASASASARLDPPLSFVSTFFVFTLLVVLLWEVASFPAMVFMAFRVDRGYRQGVATVEDVVGAHAKASLIVLPAAFLAGATVLISEQVAGTWWWVLSGVTFSVALAAAVGVGPALLARVGAIRPLSRITLGHALDHLAQRVRVPVAGIHEWAIAESHAATALVTGLGSGRRVLVSSELIRQWTDDEISVVVAHELAHHAHHDLWRALALNAALLVLALWTSDATVRLYGPALHLKGPGDLAALPLIALLGSIVWAAGTPIRHAQSRWHERRADIFALGTTGGVDAFRSAIRRLSARHLAEERPSRLTRWLYHRHPTVAERLELADAYTRERRQR